MLCSVALHPQAVQLAGAAGLKPAQADLEDRCSVQLSYAPIVW